MLSFFIPSHPILSYAIPFHSIPSYPDLFIRKKRQHNSILISIPYMVTWYWAFWGCASGSGCWYVESIWSLLGRYGFTHWLLRGCARNWVKISLAKQSHSAIGLATLWSRVIFHIYLHEVKWQPWEKWLTIGSITVSGKTPNLPTPNLCFFPKAIR